MLFLACPCGAVTLDFPTVRSNIISFSFQSGATERVIVQRSRPRVWEWQDVAEYTGTGGRIEHNAAIEPGAQLFRLKVVPLQTAPEILPARLIVKAGQAVNTNFTALGVTGALTWAARDLPAGLSLSADGLLSGTPSADAAERNETGEHTALLELTHEAGSTFRLPVEVQVRLSYALNIRANRPGGPALLQSCSICHGPHFKPNIQGGAEELVNVLSGSGAECGTDRYYISPGDASDSLIYEKVSERANCGERMPFDGPYLSEQQINRLARWIRELEPGEAD
jgi:hypothetical protein